MAPPKKRKRTTRQISVPKEDEGVGFSAWVIGNKGLRYFAGVMAAIAAIAVAWDQLGWPKPATRTYVKEIVDPLDNGIKSLTVGSLQNRIETLSGRRAAAQQVKSEKMLQKRVAKGNELTRLLDEQIESLDQSIREIDKQIEELHDQIRRKNI